LGLARLDARGNSLLHFFPRNRFRAAGVHLRNTARNFLIPSALGIRVRGAIQTLNQGASQFSSFFLSQSERLL
jgi:hypothetical protein